jgi:DNA-binding response OmpR family regulator
MRKPNTVLVSDNSALAVNFASRMRDQQIQTQIALDVDELREQLRRDSIDVVVIDAALRQGNATAITRALANRSDLRLVVLGAHDDPDARNRSFEAGADVFMQAPIEPSELVTVVRRLVRRLPPRASHWVLDADSGRLVAPGDVRIDLTGLECGLLCTLQQAPDQLAPHESLEVALWGSADVSAKGRLVVLINRFRAKLEKILPQDAQPLRTLRLRGFQFIPRLVRVS